eukprot:TRINITY_DN1644_c0_g1_i3.p1 TRINITY_DN1644_c0_g1~~TRINITY_DN1644_c0_g1_i3.p1  ORF type:complete len:371 (+),score=70.34 TRINITY_DN1644_c0_g1_i3:122-1234(+)
MNCILIVLVLHLSSFFSFTAASECSSEPGIKLPSQAPAWPHPSFEDDEPQDVEETIVISKPGTYDYSGILHLWKGTDGGCEQKENGPQILRVEADNVVVKNFHFRGDGNAGTKGLGDPIHVTTCDKGQGYSCPRKGPKNVVLDGIIGHACEDMITVGTPGADRITIKNSILYANPNPHCRDKTLQFNFGTNIRVENNTFVGGVRPLRFKSRMTVEVANNRFYGASDPIRLTVTDSDFPQMVTGPSTVKVVNSEFIGCKGAFYTDDVKGKIIQSNNKFENCPLWKSGSKQTSSGSGGSSGSSKSKSPKKRAPKSNKGSRKGGKKSGGKKKSKRKTSKSNRRTSKSNRRTSKSNRRTSNSKRRTSKSNSDDK